MAKVKAELEDLVFQTLNPKAYSDLESKIKSNRRARERYISDITKPIIDELSKYDLDASIYGRVKSYSSIYGKMVKRGKSFNEIYDNLAVRVIVDKIGMKFREIKRGDIIGETGNTGRSTAPHLHYEVHYRGTPKNPLDYFFTQAGN